MNHPLYRYLNQLATDRWARQGVRRLIRAAWIGACIWCVGIGGSLLWGWPLRLELLGALSLAIIGVAVALLLRPKLSPRDAARRLDQRFQLDEQLATAVEVAATNPPPESIAAQLLAQSEHTIRLVRRRIMQHQRPPWSEAITLVALVLVVLGLYVLVGIGRADLGSSAVPLPPLARPQDPAQQFTQEQPELRDQSQVLIPGQNGQGAPGAAGESQTMGDPSVQQALADALRDQGATRSAAEALDRGDVAGAAQELRELADQADQLGQATRNDLAEALRDAAERIKPRNPTLADQLRRSAQGLERGGQDASKALDDLAQAIEQLQQDQLAEANGDQEQANQGDQPGDQGAQANQGGEQGQGNQPGQNGQQGQGNQPAQGDQTGQGPGGDGAGRGSGGEQRQSDRSERLGVEGQPVELEAGGDDRSPGKPTDKQPTTSGSIPGFTQGDDSSGQRVQTGADPLRVPLDERDVVQGYFTP